MRRNIFNHKSSLHSRSRKSRKPLFKTDNQQVGGANPVPSLDYLQSVQLTSTINQILDTSPQQLVNPVQLDIEEEEPISNGVEEPTQALIQNNIRGEHKHPLYHLQQQNLKKYGR